jgi:predicted RNA-binding Zn ribbon-like protein
VSSARHLALELATTIRHDGMGGVADDLGTLGGFAEWITDRIELFSTDLSGDDLTAVASDEETWHAVVALRRAVRSLFARAVHPSPPSRADARSLLDPDDALRALNAAAAVPRVPRLEWPRDSDPVAGYEIAPTDRSTLLLAALATAAIAFLAGDTRERLRACPAPRCVRYFLQDDPRRSWCSPSCGNRARVARYHQRRRAG